MKRETILILNFANPFHQLLANKIRDLSVFSIIKPGMIDTKKIEELAPTGIIVCGEYKEGLNEYFKDLKKTPYPILACGEISEYFKECEDIANASFAPDKKHFRSSFYPEHPDVLDGEDWLINFLQKACGTASSWNMGSFLEQSIAAIKEKVGDKKVLLALSGGVDSSVVATLLNRAIGASLSCIFVDHGFMRKNEGEEIKAIFENTDIHFVAVDAEERFLSKLTGCSDPETKRKLIGEEFIRVFEEEAKKIGKVDFLAQGTIYPDIIESGDENHAVIKSHHNVGGLPDVVDFDDIIEPIDMLFKSEVRQLGALLGLPEHLVNRQPFPGPGLAVRVIGELNKEKLDILREADFIFREEIAAAGLDKSINQYFAVLTSLRSVGVRDGARSYDYTLALRAVETRDFMTAEFSKIPYDVLEKASSRITSEVNHINRVVYDITSKPPATIEWE